MLFFRIPVSSVPNPDTTVDIKKGRTSGASLIRRWPTFGRMQNRIPLKRNDGEDFKLVDLSEIF